MKERCDSYLGSLTARQREEASSLLEQRPLLSLRELRKRLPVWGSGRRKGEKPSESTLSECRSRLQLEHSLNAIEAQARFLEATRAKLQGVASAGQDNEALLDQVMVLVGQEVIQRTLERDDPKDRTAAARLLLKRADQKRIDRRMNFLEQQVEKTEGILKDGTLSPEQQRERMKQIFGI